MWLSERDASGFSAQNPNLNPVEILWGIWWSGPTLPSSTHYVSRWEKCCDIIEAYGKGHRKASSDQTSAWGTSLEFDRHLLCSTSWTAVWVLLFRTFLLSVSPGFAPHPPQMLCEVRAEGVIPVLQVVDACSSGAAATISKRHMWKLFSLDRFNEHVRSAGLSFQMAPKQWWVSHLHDSRQKTQFQLSLFCHKQYRNREIFISLWL